jgi:hypothetical protein
MTHTTAEQQVTRSPIEFFGREFTPPEIELIKEITTDFCSLSLDELSRTICDLLDWKRPSGRPKSLECRQMLTELSNRGLVSTPELLNRGRKGPRTLTLSAQSETRPALTPQTETRPAINGDVGSLEPLRVKVVKGGRSAECRLWRELIAGHHYLGWRLHVGANLRHLVYSERHPDMPLACLLWTSAAWKIEARDNWIGWSADERARNLQLIVNNSRFLLLPWVEVRHLASKILARCARQLPRDWEQMYGYRPLLLESFVDAVSRDLLPGSELGLAGRDKRTGADGPLSQRGKRAEAGLCLPASR